ncbi:unnamed protein product [Didymodactylos carnosus]|uniref:AAA+ ATPase domain-containing protein n=1 Tax=Didymodactylos carnosus TaxID=1234261 RepID=A0A814MSD3_9BILA|nr:unnamed protein product [Didymodactylos carnosus]CAF3847964.1 unnamed protein product [Didymodactylos carnosus]
MNPGYEGRTELPESVKILFRPTVCIVPDNQYICEIKLFANGFMNAKVLAKKIITLYRNAMKLLSKQYHYDWSLRGIKAVLTMAEQLRRTIMKDASEEVILLRALRDMNLTKFVYDDINLFLGLINDLFPNVDCPRIYYDNFNRAIEDVLNEKNYILVPEQIEKIIQLYETMMTRHSTMIVGPTSGGKTVILNTMADAQTKLGNKTLLYVLNPKAMTVIELYGFLDPLTREWTDGVLSNIYRTINKLTIKMERRYIVYDGDVDALWIENMNSVMDDNKLLTLANGERIRLQNHCAMLFEVGDLQYASPATVSRCGMVYVDPENLGPHPIWKRWLKMNLADRPSEQEYLDDLYSRYIKNILNFIYEGKTETSQRSRMKMIIPLTQVNIVVQLTKLLESLLIRPFLNDRKTQITHEFIHSIYIECMIWSFGSCLKQNDRVILDGYIKYLCPMPTGLSGIKAKVGEIPIEKPLLFDHIFQTESNQWMKWNDIIEPYEHDRTKRFSELLVSTVDTVRLEWLIASMIAIHQPILIVGDTGTSKTATIRSYIRKLNPERYVSLILNFSSRTKAIDVQRSIEVQVEKRAKDIWGPPPGTRLVLFLDDVSMPHIDTYGTQQSTALLKLFIEKRGIYERFDARVWKFISDTEIIATMGTPGILVGIRSQLRVSDFWEFFTEREKQIGGGRNPMDPRFVSHFSVFYVSLPSHETLFRIFSTILQGHVALFPYEVRELIPSLIATTLRIYEGVLKYLAPTPTKFHYVFSLRDLSRLVQGLIQTTPERFDTVSKFSRVWVHECIRIFSDRLNDQKDQEIFNNILQTAIEKNFLLKNHMDYLMRTPILFGDFRNVLQEGEAKIYEDLQDYQAVKAVFEEIIIEYNEQHDKLEIVLFNDALEHLIRIYRVLKLDCGHMLLIGSGGSGKQLLSRIAAFTADCHLFEIQLTRNYSETSFREDLKILYIQVGLRNIKTVFILSDDVIVEEGFLEYINNMLSSGMAPTLFTEEERDGIISEIREEATQNGRLLSKENVWDYFIKKCTTNFHIILCMNPIGETLRNRARNFPALINNTTIDWFMKWPQQALYAVAEYFVSRFKFMSDQYTNDIVEHMAMVHESTHFYCDMFTEKMHRSAYVTPKNYLDFIHTYLSLYKRKRQEIVQQSERLNVGIIKIDEASTVIEAMDRHLQKQRNELSNNAY